MQSLNIVVFGLSITSAWGNGHATSYRSVVKALVRRGHQVTFFEKDVPWYASHRDLPDPPFCETILYRDLEDVEIYEATIGDADMVVVGSHVQDARRLVNLISEWSVPCLAFYDMDTPVSLAKLGEGDYEYLHPDMFAHFDIYLTSSGGRHPNTIEQQWGARLVRPLYACVDTDLYSAPRRDETNIPRYALGLLASYRADRQHAVDELLLKTARALPDERFSLAGGQYPDDLAWPANLERLKYIPPHRHRAFYHDQRFTLNVTRRESIEAGHTPSVRLFEAGACATPIISDYFEGLDTLFDIGSEILVARNKQEVTDYLNMPESERLAIAQRLREKVLQRHSADHRAMELESYWREVMAPLLTQAI